MAIIQAEIIDQRDLIQEVELLPGYGESWTAMRAETLDVAEIREGSLVPGVCGGPQAVLEADTFGLRRR